MKLKPLKYIFGRMTAYIPVEGMMEAEGAVAEFVPCEGETFDLIRYDPIFKNLQQGRIHEEIHAVLTRAGFEQTDLSKNMQEQICEVVSVFMTEMYYLREK